MTLKQILFRTQQKDWDWLNARVEWEKKFKTQNQSVKMHWNFKTMLSFCLKCKQNTKGKNPRVSKANNKQLMILSKCAVYYGKRSRFISKQEAIRLLNQLGIRTPLYKIPLLGDILFSEYNKWMP